MKCNMSCPFARVQRNALEPLKVYCGRLIIEEEDRSKWIVGECNDPEEFDAECKISPSEFIKAAENEIAWINTLINIAKQEAVNNV